MASYPALPAKAHRAVAEALEGCPAGEDQFVVIDVRNAPPYRVVSVTTTEDEAKAIVASDGDSFVYTGPHPTSLDLDGSGARGEQVFCLYCHLRETESSSPFATPLTSYGNIVQGSMRLVFDVDRPNEVFPSAFDERDADNKAKVTLEGNRVTYRLSPNIDTIFLTFAALDKLWYPFRHGKVGIVTAARERAEHIGALREMVKAPVRQTT